ncbi:fad binding domain-containing protein [Diplodia corticola]|uniref:Fad binding domain-containing protein n=1 Tax=Diplodia corticola TaxID=236234 RepID=A0A1J9QMZ7_9PEZI|nr:fad binding domain-containing protein [Diplodia corticola]OJD30262.1 fad binding domain-containing protein [Diplodia corticola]
MELKDLALPLVGIVWSLIGLSCITFGLRVYVRAYMRKGLGADDGLMLLGLVLFVLSGILTTLAADAGLGIHNYGATAVEMRDALMYFTFWQLAYTTSAVFVKAGVCISLCRITTVPLHKKILWTLIAVSVVASTVACVIVFSGCRPFEATWDKTIPGAKCTGAANSLSTSYIISAITIVTDWSCALMPVFIVWDVQMHWKVKVSVCLVLGLGVLSSVATLVRLKAIPAYGNRDDFLYGMADIVVWSETEIGLAIIAGSIAALKPLLAKIVPSFGSKAGLSYSHHLSGTLGESHRLGDWPGCGTAATVVENNNSCQDQKDESDNISQKGLLGEVEPLQKLVSRLYGGSKATSMSRREFKVVIVGASIAGLTLANLFQNLNIDFVVLEAYGVIAPQVGASIGFHPNGLRILDQLGCYEDILKISAAADKTTVRTEDGRVLHSHSTSKHVLQRHGYPILFLERRDAVQILYDHVRDKTRIRTGQRVNRVELLGDGVRAYTTNGDAFEGSIVVGADGIHSTLREQMWDLANKLQPGHIPPTVGDSMPSEYGCIFGISKTTGDIKATEVHLTHMKDAVIAVMCGQKDRPFWFCFFKLEKPHYGIRLPRYTTEDELRIVEQNAKARITDRVQFADLYANVEFSTTTPLPHHVFDNFFFDRICLVGDSVHKFNPISGQGGNSAIETATCLADNLFAALDASEENTLDAAQIRDVFAATQSRRRARAQALVKASITAQRVSAWETTVLKFLDTRIAPMLDTEAIADQISEPIVGAVSSRFLPLPTPPHSIPYEDELHDAPRPRRRSWIVATATYMGLLAIGIYYLAYLSSKNGTLEKALGEIRTRISEDGGSFTLLDLESIPVVGPVLVAFATYFPATEFGNLDLRLLTFYLSISEFVIFAIWTLESCRPRNRVSPLRFALVFGALSHCTAVCFITPLHALLDTVTTASPTKFWPTSTHVPPADARAILPAMTVGMLVPTLFVFVGLPSRLARQVAILVWAFFPLYIHLSQKWFAARFRAAAEPATLTAGSPVSVAAIRRLFHFSFAISALAHFYAVGTSSLVLGSVSSVFAFRPSSLDSPLSGNHNMYLVDFYITMAAALLWSLASIRDLERNGLVARMNWPVVLSAALAGSVALGPAAVVSAILAWRESKLAQPVKAKLL